jgi:hypothetical protein
LLLLCGRPKASGGFLLSGSHADSADGTYHPQIVSWGNKDGIGGQWFSFRKTKN